MADAGHGVHDDDAGVGAAVERRDGLHDQRLWESAVEDGPDEIDAGHGGQDVHRHDAVAGWVDRAVVVHGDRSRGYLMTSIISNDEAACQSPQAYPES